MTKIIDVKKLTAEKLKAGEYREILPEIYTLKNVIENNIAHVNQDVFDHTVKVCASLEQLLAETKNQKILNYFQEKIGQYSKSDLLKIVALFHDIAKSKTIIINKDGSTMCPEHEKIGSLMVRDFINRFALDIVSEERVVKILNSHGLLHELLAQQINVEDYNKLLNKLKNSVPEFYIDIIYLTSADMMGGKPNKEALIIIQNRKRIIEDLLKLI